MILWWKQILSTWKFFTGKKFLHFTFLFYEMRGYEKKGCQLWAWKPLNYSNWCGALKTLQNDKALLRTLERRLNMKSVWLNLIIIKNCGSSRNHLNMKWKVLWNSTLSMLGTNQRKFFEKFQSALEWRKQLSLCMLIPRFSFYS